jgi:hypothetical protein
MLIFSWIVVVGLVIASLVACDRYGSPKVSRHPYLPHTTQSLAPYTTRSLATAPAPAPDMTSPLVLAAQPKHQSAPEVQAKTEPASPPMAASHSREALAARAEARPTKRRVTPTLPPIEYRQNNASPGGREFGLSGTN